MTIGIVEVARLAAWGQGSESDDHIHIEPDQFGSKHRQPVAVVIRGPILENQVLAFDPSERAQAVAEHAVQCVYAGSGACAEDAYRVDLFRSLRP
jgi:hypothetical protein